MDKQQIWKEILHLADLYNDKRFDPNSGNGLWVLNQYVYHLEDISYEAFKLARDRHIETSKWMPTVSELREAVMTNFLKRAGVPLPMQAWGEVLEKLGEDKQVNVGTLTSVNRINDHEWSHPLVKAAADQMGWDSMYYVYRSGGAIGLQSNRSQFIKSYKELVNELRTHHTLNPDLRAAIEPPQKQDALESGEDEVQKQLESTMAVENDDSVPLPGRWREFMENKREEWEKGKRIK